MVCAACDQAVEVPRLILRPSGNDCFDGLRRYLKRLPRSREIAAQIKIPQAMEQQRHQQAVYEQGALVAEKHPDWAGIAGSDGFTDWVNGSPHRTAMFNSDDAASTIELLDLYKAQHGLFNQPQSNQQSTALRQRRRSQLSDLASLPNGGSGRMPLVDESDEDAIFAAAAKAADAELRRYR